MNSYDMDNMIQQCSAIFRAHPEVKLAYAFGSQISGKAGPLSDYDFAVYLDEQNAARIFDIKTRLMDELSRCLKTDDVDVVVLDTAKGAEIKYSIITEGILLCQQEPYKVLVEPAVMNEYFDFKSVIQRAA